MSYKEVLLNESIHILELSEKVINTLEKHKIYTISQLLHTTKEEILKMSNFGQKSLGQILDALDKIGFKRP